MKSVTRIEKYISFIDKYPHVFNNDSSELMIVTDADELYKGQEELYRMADAKDRPREWYDIGVIAEDNWVVVLRDLIKLSSGQYCGYIRSINRRSQLEQSGKDVVILVCVDDAFLLVNHFRHEDRTWHWECPRGFGEAGLSPVENAIKELTEETGLFVNRILQLDDNTDRVAYFLAHCSGSIVRPDEREIISETKLVFKSEFESMIMNCKINDLYTLRAFMLADLKGLV